MLVIGLCCGRNGSAALLARGRPVAAIEEGKLSRNGDRPVFPGRALRYCLQEAGASIGDAAVIALASRPRRAWIREQRLRAHWLMPPVRNGFSTADNVQRELRGLAPGSKAAGVKERFVCYEHHLCHAASAYYASPFDRALVLTMDRAGDMWSGLVSIGEGERLHPLRPAAFPDSLGWIYSQITEVLGYRPHRDEHKTQWLSSGGEPEFLPLLRQVVSLDPAAGLPVVNRRCVAAEAGRWTLAQSVVDGLGVSTPALRTDRAWPAAVARSVQELVEERVADAAERLRRETRTDDLCLAGGLFLNTFLVRALEERTGFRRVFVQPAAGNAGTAMGAAYLASRAANGATARLPLTDVHLGPAFDARSIKEVLDNCKLVYHYFDMEERLVSAVVALLRKGQCVAWHQGRLEFGFRALGNRSILASPFCPFVAENLNHYIKHREDFHPFILSIPAEAAATFVDGTENCRFAASVARLKPALADLARFTAGGGRVRVHTVDRDVNPRFWRLLHAFGAGGPAPVLVNTSFNLFGEPLVCDPRDAVRSFFCAGVDALAIGNFLVVK